MIMIRIPSSVCMRAVRPEREGGLDQEPVESVALVRHLPFVDQLQLAEFRREVAQDELAGLDRGRLDGLLHRWLLPFVLLGELHVVPARADKGSPAELPLSEREGAEGRFAFLRLAPGDLRLEDRRAVLGRLRRLPAPDRVHPVEAGPTLLLLALGFAGRDRSA